MRPAGRPDRAAHAARGPVPEVCAQQSAGCDGCRHCRAARTRGCSVLSHRPTGSRRPIFSWLVNLMSPVYWVYLVMAVTVLFNVLKGLSRFRLWRIDSAREKLETALKKIADRGPTHAQMRSAPVGDMVAAPEQRAVARSIMEQLTALRLRCQRQVASIVTPMGDEMFYRYQQALIDEAITTLAAILAPNAATGPTEIKN